MQATSGEQSIIDIGLTVKANKKIIPSILVAHAASGCNTVAPYYAVGKTSVIKKWIDKRAKIIRKYLGMHRRSCNPYTNCRINLWCQKTSNARKPAQIL